MVRSKAKSVRQFPAELSGYVRRRSAPRESQGASTPLSTTGNAKRHAVRACPAIPSRLVSPDRRK